MKPIHQQGAPDPTVEMVAERDFEIRGITWLAGTRFCCKEWMARLLEEAGDARRFDGEREW